ncbi:hypothetical protein PTTG_02455 [Puccinia triticina 1-1 BBBD Race 1]|uniref:DPBB_1 domain-containing protein n=2 Tax=Puccinia triticina TaxID=208348 RepID=A0A180H1U9_PUCT1|nr:uncharacterized protein PtA15_4A322 [Puccinia triticina]OAV98996.1 hypothetical protein PTTG_02455 [Puccinia triticina 1-1 BBBD Race 1]WAQ83873.1 hypothetical protein PtA15_4A322 [Puccinia triticina]WAR54718.1 hypothetical protein PtB15_4B335 [Puccinia triticina]
MLFQNRFLMMALFMAQLVINPIHTLPSSQPASSGLGDNAPGPAYGPAKGKLREEDTHRGDATYYSPGLGSCGQQSGNQDLIVAVSHSLYDSYEGGNQDGNSLCGKSIRASYGPNSIVVSVVDRCEGCSTNDLDLSPAAFRRLSPLNTGRLHGIRWTFA